MDATKNLVGRTWRHFMHDSLRRNSSLLITAQAINAAGAFFFWIICAHLFSASTIGLATAFVSFAALASTFTNLGLPNTVIRFLPTSKQQGGLFAAAFSSVFAASIIGGFIALALVRTLVPKLGLVQSSPFLSIVLILLVFGTAISTLMDGTLMAFRKGEQILIKALIINVPRLIVPFFVVALGIKGITGTYAIVLLAGISYNLYVAITKLLRSSSFRPTLAELKPHREYAAGNYFGGMLGILPSTLVPLIILSQLGPEAAAYFYMPMQIAAFLGVISSSTSQALISESSQNDNEASHKAHFRNAFIHLYQTLIPAVIGLAILAWPLLKVYGGHYAANGLVPLLILAAASLFVGTNWLGDTWLNITKRPRAYFFMNGLNAALVVGGVWSLASHGLVAASIGWLVGQVISAIVYLAIFARGQLFSFARSFKTS